MLHTPALKLLRQVELFAYLTDEQLEKLHRESTEKQFRKHTVLMHEGEPGHHMYVIKTGRVRVFVSDDEGRELILYEKGPGEAIGDIALLDDKPRSASVATLEHSSLIIIGKEALLDCLRQSPETAINIIRSLTARLRDATESSRRLALENVYCRLADKLRDLAEPYDNDDPAHCVLPRKYSHQELGSMIGASREMVGKIMNELIKGKYMEVRNNRLHLLRKLPDNW